MSATVYRIVQTCTGVPDEMGAVIAADVVEEFSHRPWHENAICSWDGERLIFQAENNYDPEGSALADEFSDAVVAVASYDGGFTVNIESVTELESNRTVVETAAFVCSHVFADCCPVLLISRVDGDWQLLCGGVHAPGEVPKVVGLNHLFERDRTLLEIRDLPIGWEAARTHMGAPWHRIKTLSSAH